MKTFSPVVKPATINNAFLNGENSWNHVYGYVHPLFLTHVSKLHKVLYGLKHASCPLFGKLKSWLLHWSFSYSRVDVSLFYKNSGTCFVAVLVYFDDVLTTSSDPQLTRQLLINLILHLLSKN